MTHQEQCDCPQEKRARIIALAIQAGPVGPAGGRRSNRAPCHGCGRFLPVASYAHPDCPDPRYAWAWCFHLCAACVAEYGGRDG